MKIQNINQQNYKRPSFGAVCRLNTWVQEDDNTSHLANNETKLNKKLLYKLTRILNGTLSPNVKENNDIVTRAQYYVITRDADFSKFHAARTFSFNDNGKRTNFLITGYDTHCFKDTFTRQIHESYKRGACECENRAIKMQYKTSGYEFLKEKAKKFIGLDGKNASLNVLYKPIKNKKGEIKDYKLVDMKYSTSI